MYISKKYVSRKTTHVVVHAHAFEGNTHAWLVHQSYTLQIPHIYVKRFLLKHVAIFFSFFFFNQLNIHIHTQGYSYFDMQNTVQHTNEYIHT